MVWRSCSTDSHGTDSRGTDSRGTDSRGTDSRGTDSRGTDRRCEACVRGWLTFAVAPVRNLQLRVFALGTLELATGQEGPPIGRTDRLLGGAPAVQAAVLVFILIDSQKLQEEKRSRST